MDTDIINILLEREHNSYYELLNKFNLYNHKEIKYHHRVILLDWLMEVCYELGLKRQT